jgi:hypothetical protein
LFTDNPIPSSQYNCLVRFHICVQQGGFALLRRRNFGLSLVQMTRTTRVHAVQERSRQLVALKHSREKSD